MSRVRTICRWAYSLALAGLALGCDHIETSPGRMAPEHGQSHAGVARVMPVQPARKTLTRWFERPGRIEAIEETPVYARVTGYVEKVCVDVGDSVTGPQPETDGNPVREGQLLVELAVPELQEEFQQKKALVGQAQAEVGQAVSAIRVAKLAADSARAKLREAETQIDQAQADYEFAQSEFTRMKDLAKRGTATSEVAEEKGKQFRAADARRRQTQARVDSARAVVAESQSLIEKSEADQKAAEARLEVAHADAARFEALIGYTRIRAPCDGVVTSRNAHLGEVVKPGLSDGQPLFVLARAGVVRLVVEVPAAEAPLVTIGTEARITISAANSISFPATVSRAGWAQESGTRALRAETDLPNDDGRLRPGMIAHVKLKVAERASALSLPRSAVLSGEVGTYCFTIDAANRLVETPVETGIQAGEDVEIVSGLAGGEQVIAANAATFHAGQEVEIVEPSER